MFKTGIFALRQAQGERAGLRSWFDRLTTNEDFSHTHLERASRIDGPYGGVFAAPAFAGAQILPPD